MKTLTRMKKEAPSAEALLRRNIEAILNTHGPLARCDLLAHRELDVSVVPRLPIKKGNLPLPLGMVLNAVLDKMADDHSVTFIKQPPHYNPWHDIIGLTRAAPVLRRVG